MIEQREDRPAYVRFVREAKENKAASLKEGRYVAYDVDMALVTPPYSKDVFYIKVDQWFKNLEMDVRNGRIPQEWVDRYKKAYEAWRNGQEMPLNGTPIRGWGVISPSQQEMLIRMNILTVDDLSKVNDEGLRRIGMGAVDLRNKASAWLSQMEDKGPLTQEMAAIKKENETLKGSVESLKRQVEELMRQPKESVKVTLDDGISALDLLEDEERTSLKEEYQKLYGKPPHHLMKTETIKRRIEEKR